MTLTAIGSAEQQTTTTTMNKTKTRNRTVVLALVLCVLLASTLSVTVGASRWSLGESLSVLRDGGTDLQRGIMFGIRIPRTWLGLACGAALGLAGCLTHVMTKNPMADPGLLGVNAGAALGVVLTVYGMGVSRVDHYMWGAVAGALLASAVVMASSRMISVVNYVTAVVICGAVVTAICNALTSALVLFDESTLNVFRFWSVGSLQNRDLSVLYSVLPLLLAGLVCAAIVSRYIGALMLGDDVAASLGVNVSLLRLVAIAGITLLAAGSTAAIGSLSFLGLLAPLAARRLVGAQSSVYPLASALLGAVILLLADSAGRVLLPTGELNVGIVLALCGAPVFLILARRITGGGIRGEHG